MRRRIFYVNDEDLYDLRADNYDAIQNFMDKNKGCSSMSGHPIEITESKGRKYILDVFYKDGSGEIIEIETNNIDRVLQSYKDNSEIENFEYLGIPKVINL